MMLFDDLSIAVQSLHWRQSEERARTVISGGGEKNIQRVTSIISGGQNFGDFDDRFSGFVASVTRALASYGCAPYEIVSEVDSRGRSQFATSLEFLPPDSLERTIRGFYQYPQDYVNVDDPNQKSAVFIPRRKVIIFYLPFFRPIEWRSLVRKLAELGENIIPDFYIADIEQGVQTNFDLDRYRKTKELEIARVTKPFGWDARGLFRDRISEWYMLRRRLRFERFRVEVRNRIVNTLNDEMKRMPGLSTETDIRVNGGLNPEYIGRCERQLQDGSTGFNDLLRPFLKT